MIRAHLAAAWSAIRHSLRAAMDRGTPLAELGVFLTDQYDEQRAAAVRARGGFVDPPTIAEVRSRAELVEIAKRVSKPMADALSQPPPPQTVWVFVFTIFGPTVVALAYDSDAPLPSFGDA